MMVYSMFILGVIFVVSFVGFSSKPSPIYGGLGLIVSGGVGCGIIVNFGGSFLGLMVFLIYLGGMLVVFGYTTAMAMEQYPEAWMSSMAVFGSFISGLIAEFLFILYVLIDEELESILELNDIGDWITYSVDDSSFVSQETVGVGALYSFGSWQVVVTIWALLIGVIIILEITRGY
uniref:NADH-ubiquinone oxidoreductase chain 6 n=1 Tax=Lasionycteris noctivagans TaxID=27667 RepID=A0A7L7YX27_LASNO|nr:NADH dehydrogenase subunit 6 [Lasionycteris noctivagans]QOD41468.1 NADH dehydrogenase subunit 6 [Lasionycteris noctivagans]QOD41481.1 NADH dehydrogenase subunit 6 [Lasionycteris noctivagans]QOD41494.1 NADH dehydrogenase subunit 6 [Lasionycteris noctivagans]